MTWSATLTRLRFIAAVPLQKRRSQASLGGLWFTVGFTLFIPVLMLLSGLWFHVMLLIGGVSLLAMSGILALGWWAAFVIAVGELSRVPTSVLVPGHARHLGLAMWLVAGAISAAFGLGFGLLVHWFVFPTLATFILLALVGGLLSGQWIGIGFAIFLVAAPLPHQGVWVADLFVGATPASRADGFMVLAATTFVCLWMLSAMAPSPRRPPRAPNPAMENMRSGVGHGAAPEGLEPVDRAREAMVAKGTLMYAWRRTGQLPPQAGDPLVRALSVLPLNVDWLFALRRRLRRWFTLLLAVLALSHTPLVAYAHQAFGVIAYLAVMFVAGEAMSAWSGLDATRREQQFLALLPGLPHGAAVGRALALRLTASYAAGLVVNMGGLAALAAVLSWSGVASAWWYSAASIEAMALSFLPLAGLLWKDWARAGKPPTGMNGLFLAVVPVVLWSIALGACQMGWTRMPAVALVYAGLPALWCMHRWRRMASEAAPFPMGRLT